MGEEDDSSLGDFVAWIALNEPPMVDGSRTSVDLTSTGGPVRATRIAWQIAGSSKRTRIRSGASTSETQAGSP